MSSQEIGGYFELELGTDPKLNFDGARMFQSARAAFCSILAEAKPKRVWAPRFICDAMLAPLYDTNTEISFYSLTEKMGVPKTVNLHKDEWLLYVNYFGVCDEQEKCLLNQFDPENIILDHSQAFFSTNGNALACIDSPRKFFGLPDGGILRTKLDVPYPRSVDSGSMLRISHLLQRLNGSAQSGYGEFRRAEESLSSTGPLRMSRLTERLLRSIDFERVKTRRNSNFSFLQRHLKCVNQFVLDLDMTDGPLCYPFMNPRHGLREHLIKNRVFTATYWPEALNRVERDSLERKLIAECIPIPCDQRYDDTHMQHIVNLIYEGVQ